MNEQPDPELQRIDEIYDALERGDPERAFRLVQEAAEEGGEDDPVVLFLAGIALLELDQPEQAADALGRACELDPEEAEFRANLAYALYRGCRFEEAQAEATRALELDDSLPDAHVALALLLERGGEFERSDRHFTRAAALDSEGFPAPHRLGDAEFQDCLVRAQKQLIEPFAGHLDNVAVTVETLPADEILREDDPPLDPELFGLFVGVPLTEQSSFGPGGDLPPRILLFRRNLERCFPEPEELVRQISITLYHELGHYLGLDEEELAAIELD